MMTDSITVEVLGAPDRLDRRLVVAKQDGAELHRDKFDINSSYFRGQFGQAIAVKLGHDTTGNGDYSSIGNMILAAADRADRGGDKVTYYGETFAKFAERKFPTEYLVEGVLAARQPAIVGGPKKALKTSLAIDLAFSLSQGVPFLGRFNVPRAVRTILMTGESGEPVIQETGLRIAAAKFLEPANINNLIVSTDLPKFGEPAHNVAIHDFLQDHEAEVVIIDPCYKCMNGADASNLFVQGALLQSITREVDAVGATLVLCHHTKKTTLNQFAAPELEDLAWSGFAEHARQWLLLNRREAYEPGSGEHRLWLSVGGSMGHSGLWGLDVSEGVGHGNRHWSVSINYPDEIQQQLEDRREQAKWNQQQEQAQGDVDAIVTALARCPGYQDTKYGIRKQTRIANQRLDNAIEEALEQGRIVTTSIKKPNRVKPYEGYKLPDEAT